MVAVSVPWESVVPLAPLPVRFALTLGFTGSVAAVVGAVIVTAWLAVYLLVTALGLIYALVAVTVTTAPVGISSAIWSTANLST